MIIAVDGRELEGKRTGVGVYLENILARLVLPAGARLQLYFRNEVPNRPDIDAERILLRSKGGNLYWEQWTLRRELARRRIRFFFSPGYSCPWYLAGIQAVTVHDLSFFRSPHWFSARERISRQINVFSSLKQAERVYVVSPMIREELIWHLHVPCSRILLTPNGVTRKTEDPGLRDSLRVANGLQESKLVLYVGSIFNRRHLPELIRAVAKLDDTHVLVIIGENRTHPRQDLEGIAADCGIRKRVRLLDYVSDAVLEEHYRMADLFVYLSEYEGFGIPPLEAMSYGIPVLLSACGVLDMIFRNAAHFVPDFSPERLAGAIEHCLTEPGEKERLAAAGRAMAAQYPWEETARVISEDWERLLAGTSQHHNGLSQHS